MSGVYHSEVCKDIFEMENQPTRGHYQILQKQTKLDKQGIYNGGK